MDLSKVFFEKPKIFFTSDLHLDHANIIKYCKRPFPNVSDMNSTLIRNWNDAVSNKDTIYFLGDLAFGRSSMPTDYWLKKLNGKIIFIRGNHDKSSRIQFYDSLIFEHAGMKFFLTHRPENVPKDWDGWAICGHHHNHYPLEHPFINKKTKKINVSVELTRYRPVSIDEIMDKIKEDFD